MKLFEEMQEVNLFVDGNEDISSLSYQTATVCIKSLFQTRWTTRADAAMVVIDKQQPLIETLETMQKVRFECFRRFQHCFHLYALIIC